MAILPLFAPNDDIVELVLDYERNMMVERN